MRICLDRQASPHDEEGQAWAETYRCGRLVVTSSPQFTTSEAGGAQLQALNTLVNCGWRYVTRAEGDQWRDGRRTLAFLETQLRADLARINRIQNDGRAHSFSEANIDTAVRRLADRIPEGVVRA